MSTGFALTADEGTRRCYAPICTQEGVSTSRPSLFHLSPLESLRAPLGTRRASHVFLQSWRAACCSGAYMTCAGSLQINARDQTGEEEFSSGEATRPGLRTSGMALMRHYPAEQVWLTLMGNQNQKKKKKKTPRVFEMQMSEKPRCEALTCSAHCLMGVFEPPTHVVCHVMEPVSPLALSRSLSLWREQVSQNPFRPEEKSVISKIRINAN